MERLMIILYVLITLLFLYIAKKIADRITRFDDDAAVGTEKNLAVALRRFGLYVGICAALAGVMSGGIKRVDYLIFLGDGVITVLLFFAANYLNDYVVVPGVRNNELIQEGNVPTGLIEAGSFISIGILLNGAFSGDVGGALTGIVFFILGQGFLLLAVWIHQRLYRFQVTEAVKNCNVSAGITVAGLLVSYSLILRSSIAGDFMGWVESLSFFFVSAVTGMACLLVLERIAGWIFLPKLHLTDEIRNDNAAAALLVQSIVLALSLVISRAIAF